MKSRLISRVRDRVRPYVEVLDDSARLVQKPDGPHLRRRSLGPAAARTSLVWQPGPSRRHMPAVHRALGAWQLEEQLRWVLRRLEVDVVLDVGANEGQYAKRLRKLGYRGRILSFEPVKEFSEKLYEASAGDPLWEIHPYALGDEETTAEINVSPGQTLSSLLPATEFGRSWNKGLREVEIETIQVRRLDNVLDEVLTGGERVYLKIDTQGFDMSVVRGGGERISEILALQTEASWLPLYDGAPLLEEHLGELRRRGFDVVGVYPVGRQWRTMRVIEFDVLMVRPEPFGESD